MHKHWNSKQLQQRKKQRIQLIIIIINNVFSNVEISPLILPVKLRHMLIVDAISGIS